MVIQTSSWRFKTHSVFICVQVGWDINQNRICPFVTHSAVYTGTALVNPGPCFDDRYKYL